MLKMLKLVDPLVKAFLLGQARTLAAAWGGILVSDGIITQNQTNDLVGSICFLAAAGYSAYDKLYVNRTTTPKAAA